MAQDTIETNGPWCSCGNLCDGCSGERIGWCVGCEDWATLDLISEDSGGEEYGVDRSKGHLWEWSPKAKGWVCCTPEGENPNPYIWDGEEGCWKPESEVAA